MPDRLLPHELDLSGHWRAIAANDELRRTWQHVDWDDAAMVDVDVPGHWQRHPAFADADGPLLYRRRFQSLAPVAGERAWLVFDRLCAQGDVWLDGGYLGDTEGAFAPHRFEVTAPVRDRHEHVLGVEVASPPVADPRAKRELLGTWHDGPYVTPGWNPGGLWAPVHLRRTGPVAVTARRVLCTEATAERAVVGFWLTLDATEPTTVTITTRIGSTDHVQTRGLAGGANEVSFTVPVERPALWWPRALGAQPMSDVDVEIRLGDRDAATTDQRCSDHFSTRIGLRQVALRDWVLSVNGERLFCKGVLAGPAAEDLGTAPAEVFTEQVASACDLGADLLRVHAHLSRAELYEEADRAGLLIWQDLPLYRGLHRGVRRQAQHLARAAVEELGHHPSLAIWCGHDAPDEATSGPDDATRRGFTRELLAHQVPNWSRSMLDRSVGRALSSSDPSRPVVASSGVWPHPPSLDGTDVHLSLGWVRGEAEDLAGIARTVPRAVRFVVVQPNPSLPDDAGFCRPAQWPDLDVERLAEAHGFDFDLFQRRLPPSAFATFEEWQRATRALQAELLRSQVETLRRLKYHPTGGVVVAHLRDLRPTIAPSLVDHTGAHKPAFAALRDAFAPVIVTLDRWPRCAHAGERVACDVHVVSDRRAPLPDARCTVQVRWDDGDERWEFGGDVDADTCALVGRISVTVPDDATRLTATLELVAGDVTATARYTAPVHVHVHDPA